jgi:hypothetical protein
LVLARFVYTNTKSNDATHHGTGHRAGCSSSARLNNRTTLGT